MEASAGQQRRLNALSSSVPSCVARATFDRVRRSVRSLHLAAFIVDLPAEDPNDPTMQSCLDRATRQLDGRLPTA
jgi:hypothetical protein